MYRQADSTVTCWSKKIKPYEVLLEGFTALEGF